jgi:hypothetical protein
LGSWVRVLRVADLWGGGEVSEVSEESRLTCGELLRGYGEERRSKSGHRGPFFATGARGVRAGQGGFFAYFAYFAGVSVHVRRGCAGACPAVGIPGHVCRCRPLARPVRTAARPVPRQRRSAARGRTAGRAASPGLFGHSPGAVSLSLSRSFDRLADPGGGDRILTPSKPHEQSFCMLTQKPGYWRTHRRSLNHDVSRSSANFGRSRIAPRAHAVSTGRCF